MNIGTTRGVVAATAVLALGLGLGACAKAASTDTRKPGGKAGAPEPGTSSGRPVDRGGGFTIKLDRPLVAGLRYKVVAKGAVDSKTTVNGKSISAQAVKMTYAYEAVVTVKGVHACGKATKEELKIVKLQVTQGGATRDLLPADTVVLAEAVGAKEKFTVKGKPVVKDVDKVLGFVVSLYDGDATTTDDVFGPGGPKKPGDSWKPNVPKMLAGLRTQFKDAALWPRPTDVTGRVTFVAARKVNGMDVFEIKARARLNNLAPKMGSVVARAGHLEIAISGWVPRDPKVILAGDMSMTMKMHVVGEMRRGGKMYEVVVDYALSQKGSKTPVE